MEIVSFFLFLIAVICFIFCIIGICCVIEYNDILFLPHSILFGILALLFSYISCDLLWKMNKSDIVEINRTDIIKTDAGIVFIAENKPFELTSYEAVHKFINNGTVIYKQEFSPRMNLWNQRTEFFKMFDQNGKLLAEWRTDI